MIAHGPTGFAASCLYEQLLLALQLRAFHTARAGVKLESMATPVWIRPESASHLELRDYSKPDLASQLAGSGLEIGIATQRREELDRAWIPGVETVARPVFMQRHRGYFGELGREGEGMLGRIGMWPTQFATACMYAGSAKGFHIHPPHIPAGVTPEDWFRRVFIEETGNYALRPYDREQWDIMFFVRGRAEMLLVDERAGLPRRIMRLWIDGDNHRGANNGAVIIPPGVAHALRAEGGEDLIMVYGTSTRFNPEAEGRIASAIEVSRLPEDWQRYLDS